VWDAFSVFETGETNSGYIPRLTVTVVGLQIIDHAK